MACSISEIISTVGRPLLRPLRFKYQGIRSQSLTTHVSLNVHVASKVFEGRIASTHMAESVPDFEAVYHVVGKILDPIRLQCDQ